MIRRRGVPDGGCSMCCRLKQKLDELWQRTTGCILRIRGITPDGQGDFALEAGTNINITEVSNGVRIDTTGGVSYYEPADGYVEIDNNTLEIGVKAGVQDGLATQNDLETVASAVTNIIDGTTQVTDAAHADSADSATYLGSSSSNVGSDTKPIKIVNGQAVAVTNDLLTKVSMIMAFNTTGETIAANTVSAIQLGNYRGNDTDTFTLSNNKVTVKKTGYYYIHFELLGKFGAAGRAQVGISYNGDNEYSYAITYVQGISGSETITGSYVLHITSPNQTIGLTGWCENGSILVSNAKQATKLIILKMS